MMKLLEGRQFQVWDYTVSHKRLLIRSPRNEDFGYNVDIIFEVVKSINIQTSLGEISIEDDNTYESDYKRILIRTEQQTYEIIAYDYRIERSETDIFESPLDTI
jgi:hypothetical protein